MRLPGNSIGISDILQWRDCPRKWAFQMRRHFEEGGDPPEDVHPDTMYGKALHDGVAWIEAEMLTDEEAVDRCFDRYGHWLEPEDADRLRNDFDTYRTRDDSGVILVANETEIKVPLFTYTYPGDSEPTVIYFRARIDRLYRNAQNPAVFTHRDYKTSKWRKTAEEVHADKQLWAYNCAIHRYWPECESLTQIYDQLQYGEEPTHKSGAQRAQMWTWLKREVLAIVQFEGEIEPTFNEWCPWCPIMESCSEVKRLSEWSVARIKELAPHDDEKKVGSALPEGADFADFVDDLEAISIGRKMAERFEKTISGELKRMPDTRLEELGYKKSQRSSKVWSLDALRAVHELIGDERFYQMISMSQTKIGNVLDGEEKDTVLSMGRKVDGATMVTKLKT